MPKLSKETIAKIQTVAYHEGVAGDVRVYLKTDGSFFSDRHPLFYSDEEVTDENFDYIMDDLYCIDCYVLFTDAELYNDHLDACQKKNRITGGDEGTGIQDYEGW